MAVGHEWAHAKLLGQGQGLLVVGFGLRNIGGVGVGLDNAKLVQRGRAPGVRAATPPRRVPPDDRPR